MLTSALCMLASIAGGQPQPGFNPKDVVRHARQMPNPELRLRGCHGLRGLSPTESRRTRDSPPPAPRSPAPGLDDGEFLIDTTISQIPGGGTTWRVAFDGNNYLVTWSEEDATGNSDVYASRVSRTGTVIDTDGIAVAVGLGDQACPAVAFDGTNYLIAWDDYDQSAFTIRGARVSPAGVLLDTSPIVISAAPGGNSFSAVAYAGGEYLVVWQGSRNGAFQIFGARVTRAGVVLDSNGIAVSSPVDCWLPAVSFDGSNFLVVWEREDSLSQRICGARVSLAGTVLDPTGIMISPDSVGWRDASVASCTGTSLVVWENYPIGNDCYLYGARVSSSGSVLDPSGIPISVASGSRDWPDVAFDGTNFIVVWDDWRAGDSSLTYGARVTQNGAVLDPNGFVVINAGRPYIAFGGTNYLVAGTQAAPVCTRLTPAGVVLDSPAVLLTFTANQQEAPALASNGTDYLTVWADNRRGLRLYGARIQAGGRVLDPGGIGISRPESYCYESSLGSNGSDYLAAWAEWHNGADDIYCSRITQTGMVLDPGGVAVCSRYGDDYSPCVGSDGHDYLMAWTSSDSASGRYEIYAARVTADGLLLDSAGLPLCRAPSDQMTPSVSFGDSNYLVAWMDLRNQGQGDIYAARVTRSGQVLDSLGIRLSTATDYEGYPSVDFDGDNYLVVWGRNKNGDCDLYGARVSRGGVLLDSGDIPIWAGPGTQFFSTSAFDGTAHTVLWEDDQSNDTNVCGIKVSPAGVTSDPFTLVSAAGAQRTPCVATTGSGHLLAIYEGWTGIVGGKRYNSQRIWGKFGPFPGIQEAPSRETCKTNSLPTIVRGTLFLPRPLTTDTRAPVFLLDISGRKVLDLSPGANDISRLAPGVYFLRSADGGQQAAEKVVIQQ